jgi:hypothetical protein
VVNDVSVKQFVLSLVRPKSFSILLCEKQQLQCDNYNYSRSSQTKVSNEAHHFICNVFFMSMMKVVENLKFDRGGC